jgi:hypothetical protein
MINRDICRRCGFHSLNGTEDVLWGKGWAACKISERTVEFRVDFGGDVDASGGRWVMPLRVLDVAEDDPPKGCDYRLEHVVSQK